MKCVMCDNPKSLKKQSQTIKYTECGLDNVTLRGVEYFKCEQCGEEYYGFGDQEQLHRLIAHLLIQKGGLLTGKELRFLRTYLGFSTEVFSELTDYDASTISRVENGKQGVQKKYDRLVRALALLKNPDRNYSLHDIFLRKKTQKSNRIEILSQRGRWKIAA